MKRRSNKGNDDDDNNDDEGSGGGGAVAPIPPQREAEMDPAFRRGVAPDDKYRTLMERLEKLRKGPTAPPRPPRPTPTRPELPPRCDPENPFAHLEDPFDAYEDPTDTLRDKLDRVRHDPRDPEPAREDEPPPPYIDPDNIQLPDVPETPILDEFARPLTRIGEDGKTIEITPKTQEIEEKNLSEQLQQLFPDVEKINKEKEKEFNIETENLTEILSKIGKSAVVPFEFEFFSGGKNEKFAEIVRSLAPSTDNLEFLTFLQSDVCKKILTHNKLKIHVETGNIYYNNVDTNESIHNFINAQQNPITGYIKHNFTFDRDYNSYFDWLLNGFTRFEKQKLDVFKNKNSKFLFYHFNDYLQESRRELKKVKHSVVTEDYIAAEEIQNNSWQYFVESVLNLSTKPKEKEPIKQFQTDTLENVTIAKQ